MVASTRNAHQLSDRQPALAFYRILLRHYDRRFRAERTIGGRVRMMVREGARGKRYAELVQAIEEPLRIADRRYRVHAEAPKWSAATFWPGLRNA